MLDGVCKEKIERMILAHLIIKYLKQMLSEGGHHAN